MSVIQRNNVQVVGDQGPVLLYAHGFGCSQNMWSRITPAFADSHRQVLFDYVGSGSGMTLRAMSRSTSRRNSSRRSCA